MTRILYSCAQSCDFVDDVGEATDITLNTFKLVCDEIQICDPFRL